MIIFVGDKPSPKMRPGAKPFEGAACENRLKEWIQFITEGNPHSVVNQVDSEYWNIKALAAIKDQFVALGNAASDKLTSLGIPHFKLPHPSGRNRQINDALFIKMRLSEAKYWLRSRQK